MYAKSIIEYVQTRARERAWSRHMGFVPVVMAVGVAAMPFTLKTPASNYEPPIALSEPVVETDSPNPFTGLVQASVVTVPKRPAMALEAQQRAVASYIKRKYGVSAEVVHDLVKTAFAAGKRYGVDPLLVVAMMAVESSYNPIAESYAGAKGLMQIIPKYHPEKFVEYGGEHAVFDPRVNILVGTRIVREYLMLNGGDLVTALQTYAGALADREAIYTQRVLNEKDHLDTLAGFPKSDRRQRVTLQVGPERPDAIVVPRPRLNLQLEAPVTTPLPSPALRSGEEAAHTPPTQPQPAAQPVANPTPVNLTQAQPESVRF